MIDDDVIVRVLGIKGGQVTVGISAPKEIAVHREEIYQKIQQDKLAGQQDRSASDEERRQADRE